MRSHRLFRYTPLCFDVSAGPVRHSTGCPFCLAATCGWVPTHSPPCKIPRVLTACVLQGGMATLYTPLPVKHAIYTYRVHPTGRRAPPLRYAVHVPGVSCREGRGVGELTAAEWAAVACFSSMKEPRRSACNAVRNIASGVSTGSPIQNSNTMARTHFPVRHTRCIYGASLQGGRAVCAAQSCTLPPTVMRACHLPFFCLDTPTTSVAIPPCKSPRTYTGCILQGGLPTSRYTKCTLQQGRRHRQRSR
jgi:hypothetical protein